MATVTTSVIPTLEPFWYAGLDDQRRRDSAQPRGELRAFSLSATVAATGPGDNQRVDVTVDLPGTFAYALIDAWARLFPAAGATNNFGESFGFTLDDAATGPRVKQPFALEGPSNAALVSSNFQARYYAPPQGRLPKTTVIPQPGKDVRLFGSIYNTTANDGAYTLEFFSRFLIVDVQQAFHAEINTPIATR